MKVVHDNDLPHLYIYIQGLAKKIAQTQANDIIEQCKKLFHEDEKVGDLGYSGAMTFLNTISSHLFCHLFNFSCIVGKKFPDAEHSGRDLFEEVHHGLRLYLDMPALNHDEHKGGIKKIAGKPFQNIDKRKPNVRED